MKTVDCIEEICLNKGKIVTGYRPRIYSTAEGYMVEISGDKALQDTPQKAFNYATEWLII